MKFIVATSSENGQKIMVPLKRISNIRYPNDNAKTVIIWNDGDGSTDYAEVEETPNEFRYFKV